MGGQKQNFLIYVDDRIIVSSEPVWLQGSFSTLVGLFDWVGLSTNVRKTVGMVCHPCQAACTQSEVAYKCRITSAVPPYW